MWNSTSCQQGGLPSYTWFQSQAAGAEQRIDVYFDAGFSSAVAFNGSTACGIFRDGPVPVVRIYSKFRKSNGQESGCSDLILDKFIAHELGHYLGVGHTPTNASCSGHMMYPITNGDESIHANECAMADSRNETGWESGEIGCTDNDWCDPDHCSPIVIDFGGDLFDFTSSKIPVTFDIDGSESPRQIGWTNIGSDDGFLCRDLDRNGRIDSGAELFGTATRLSSGELAANGYEAMRELDRVDHGGNGDGFLGPEDLGFAQLCIWHDLDRDAISDPGELQKIAASGVVKMDLGYEEFPWLDEHNNLLLFHGGAFISRDGSDIYVRTVDVFFSSGPQAVSIANE